ncbi:MAG: hypothetical protein BWY67_01648 [Bacteroidetes bacterium ADurb.Bin397]|nr:MAG: hypothetical protein BWY67_01648 [Bacteroidetes bacterium ADurb.Bin397]
MQQGQRITVADHDQAAGQCDGYPAQLDRRHPLLPCEPGDKCNRYRIQRHDERTASGGDVTQPVEETEGVEKNAGDCQPGNDAPLTPVRRAWNIAFCSQFTVQDHIRNQSAFKKYFSYHILVFNLNFTSTQSSVPIHSDTSQPFCSFR